MHVCICLSVRHSMAEIYVQWVASGESQISTHTRTNTHPGFTGLLVLSITMTTPSFNPCPTLMPSRWPGSTQPWVEDGSGRFCWWWLSWWSATWSAGCLTAWWRCWPPSAGRGWWHPCSALCHRCWPSAALPSIPSSTFSWTSRWVELSGVGMAECCGRGCTLWAAMYVGQALGVWVLWVGWSLWAGPN